MDTLLLVIALVIIVKMLLKHLEKEAEMKLFRAFLDKGQPIPDSLGKRQPVPDPFEFQNCPDPAPAARKWQRLDIGRFDLRAGLIFLAIGVGLLIWLWEPGRTNSTAKAHPAFFSYSSTTTTIPAPDAANATSPAPAAAATTAISRAAAKPDDSDDDDDSTSTDFYDGPGPGIAAIPICIGLALLLNAALTARSRKNSPPLPDPASRP
jgi:hypothetical protein